MSIKNIKASFIIEEKVTVPSKNCIFKRDNVVYTIYPHVQNLVNVTGIKSFQHLELIYSKVYLECHLLVTNLFHASLAIFGPMNKKIKMCK